MIDPKELADKIEFDYFVAPEHVGIVVAALRAYEPPHVHDWPKMWWTGEEGVRWSRACMGRGCGKIQYADLVPVEETS